LEENALRKEKLASGSIVPLMSSAPERRPLLLFEDDKGDALVAANIKPFKMRV
jgi:hypothetical protein